MTDGQLIDEALRARELSYSPYSSYQVGAALLCADGKVFTGCNIENAAYGPSNCAERTAFFKAVSEGILEFKKIAIVGSPKGEVTQYAFPCGVCRQVMMEFCNPKEFQIIVAKGTEDYKVFYLQELLPEGFGPGNLKQL
ncbi:MAG: cytidine deaminase [Lachnospiraceae bacterium]|nr:cytidine deaminase [Lachnospiraceae bacterium]